MPDAFPTRPARVSVDFEPIGRRVEVEAGTDLLSAARAAGIQIVSVCGGIGSCTSCRVRLVLGTLSPLTQIEEDALQEEERVQGFRLACQAHVLSDAKIDVPPESLGASQRLQVEGEATDVVPDPAVTPVDLSIDPPSLHDLRSDATLLGHALQARGLSTPHINLPVLTDLSDRLRDQGRVCSLARPRSCAWWGACSSRSGMSGRPGGDTSARIRCASSVSRSPCSYRTGIAGPGTGQVRRQRDAVATKEAQSDLHH
jgi:uncharacterized 2Fe-2S/4Fe-4S cluster protein (DUF4445 family)